MNILIDFISLFLSSAIVTQTLASTVPVPFTAHNKNCPLTDTSCPAAFCNCHTSQHTACHDDCAAEVTKQNDPQCLLNCDSTASQPLDAGLLFNMTLWASQTHHQCRTNCGLHPIPSVSNVVVG